jgi:Xaa-Pro aminopeptidase
MGKIIAIFTIFFLIFTCLSSVTQSKVALDMDNSNEPDVIKNQFLIESAKITDIGMQAAKDMLVRAFSENITEAAVARAAEQAMIDHGSSEYVEAFGVLVASGEQSALPHGDASDDEINQILPGEVVVVDLGARYRGYCTDLTRTFFMGVPTEEMVQVYEIVMKAQDAGIRAVCAGALAREVDAAARDIISGYGYGENFTHGLGHGIGLYIHMPPTLSPNSNEVLFQSGDMAITIEPGIYLTGRWGIRIEDDVLVKRTGYEIITFAPKGLSEAILYPVYSLNDTHYFDSEKSEENQNLNNILFIGIILIISAIALGFILYKKYIIPQIKQRI